MSKKTYIGISRDHSGSMRSLTTYAAKDYNQTIAAIKKAAESNNEDTIVSVVECGAGSGRDYVKKVVVNSSLAAVEPLMERAYIADGSGTPLWDSIGDLIDMMESTPDAKNPDVSFLIMAITDGQENSSHRWTLSKLKDKINRLQATDKWTFVFRVPRGDARTLINLGIPAGNILEWEQTQRGMETSTLRTQEAFTDYYSARAKGSTMSTSFYTNTADLQANTAKAVLTDISAQVKLWGVNVVQDIRPFVEANSGAPMIRGAAFYQLVKPEREVQDYKLLAIRNKTTGAIYSGAGARDLLGLPHHGTVKVIPGDHGTWDIFVQSTSVNRKLQAGTFVLYWPGHAGV